MAVKQLFNASCMALLRWLLCVAVYFLFLSTGLHAQDSSVAVEKHIYDSSENFFSRKVYANDNYYSFPLKDNKEAERALIELKKDKAFWYVDAIEKWQEKKVAYRRMLDSLGKSKGNPPIDEQLFGAKENLVGPFTRAILWALIIGILFFAFIYFLTANKLSLFAKPDHASQANNDSEGPGVNIFESRFEEMLSRAAAEKNFRLMTRILYLQTLRLLSDKNMIRYNPSYTNLEYLHQLHPSDHYLDFFTITRHYEYVWYGKFELSEPVYRQIENAIRSFQKKIG